MSKRSKKRRTLWFAPIAIAFVVATFVLVPKYSKRTARRLPIKIKELKIQGMQSLSAASLKELINFHEGDPLFGSFRSYVSESVRNLRSEPRVKDVTVLRDITGQVVVKVSERKRVALVNLSRLYYIDRDGELLDPVREKTPEATNFVVITGAWGRARAEDAPRLRGEFVTALSLLDSLIAAGLDQMRISEIHHDRELGWVCYQVGSDARLIFGFSDFEAKAKRLTRILPDIRAKALDVREIDLDYRDRVIVKLKMLT